MKLYNRTDFPDHFLRRLTVWCCQQVGVPVRHIRRVRFVKTRGRHAYSGLYTGHGFTVRIGPDSAYPVAAFVRHGVPHPAHADRIEGLVSTTAHEAYHGRQGHAGAFRGPAHDEPAAIQAETTALNAFRAHREALLAAWLAPPPARPARAKPDVVTARAGKAAAALAAWERKLKTAQRKVREYRKRVRYYDRKLAGRAAAAPPPAGPEAQP